MFDNELNQPVPELSAEYWPKDLQLDVDVPNVDYQIADVDVLNEELQGFVQPQVDIQDNTNVENFEDFQPGPVQQSTPRPGAKDVPQTLGLSPIHEVDDEGTVSGIDINHRTFKIYA